MSERWKLGDVIIWLVTGNEQGARADIDVSLGFFDDSGKALGWVKAFERSDLGGFEEGETNSGYLGNINRQTWLRQLLERAHRLDLAIEAAGGDDWFVESVSLDFRIGPVVDVSTALTWSINDWVRAGGEPLSATVDGARAEGASMFTDVGFDKELEIETGSDYA